MNRVDAINGRGVIRTVQRVDARSKDSANVPDN